MKNWAKFLGTGIVAAAAVEYGIAEYFFRRTMIRQNATTERTMDMAGTDWNLYMPFIKERKEWLQKQSSETVSITSFDGLKLQATYFPGMENYCGNKTKKIVLCFHGYTSQGMSDFIGLAQYYLERGYQLLLPDGRAHGASEGTYIGFGCLDRFDAKKWIEFVEKHVGTDCEIWLHGISMGAATVLMASGLRLPKTVKGIISDCAFTSAFAVFSHVLKSMYHLPSFPILHLADQMTKQRAGFGLAQCNAANEVKKATVPILLIHGTKDTFVPCGMCQEIYNNCASEKDMLLVQGAGHVEAFYKDRVLYENKLTNFLEMR